MLTHPGNHPSLLCAAVPASQYSPSCPSEAEMQALLPGEGGSCTIPNEGCAYVSHSGNQGGGAGRDVKLSCSGSRKGGGE